ncbi:MAG: TerB family tellurite resistance protein [Paludibacteraceae bacterium]|nr:TerB family tellurite resistance protein [Paludibacteraceae bacterium]
MQDYLIFEIAKATVVLLASVALFKLCGKRKAMLLSAATLAVSAFVGTADVSFAWFAFYAFAAMQIALLKSRRKQTLLITSAIALQLMAVLCGSLEKFHWFVFCSFISQIAILTLSGGVVSSGLWMALGVALISFICSFATDETYLSYGHSFYSLYEREGFYPIFYSVVVLFILGLLFVVTIVELTIENAVGEEQSSAKVKSWAKEESWFKSGALFVLIKEHKEKTFLLSAAVLQLLAVWVAYVFSAGDFATLLFVGIGLQVIIAVTVFVFCDLRDIFGFELLLAPVMFIPFVYLVSKGDFAYPFFCFVIYMIVLCVVLVASCHIAEEKRQENRQREIVRTVAGMAAVLMRYNGGYTEKACELFRSFVKENFGSAEFYKKECLEEAEKRIEQLTGKRNLNFKKICVEVNRNLSYERKVEMMRLLYDVAILDGGIYPEERKLLSQIMAHIRISAEQAQIFENTYSRYYYDSRASQERAKGAYTSSGTYIPSRLVEAYAVFGLKPDTALDEVKRVYRRLVFENHPDRLAHADEATRAAAEERTRELNRAMSLIEKYS